MTAAFYELPVSLDVGGKTYPIRSDYRAALSIFAALSDPDAEDAEKADWMGYVLYPDWDTIDDKKAALEAAVWFLDAARPPKPEDAHAPQVVDWQHDWQMIAPACSRVAGRSIREIPYLHWWDFLGLYQEIGECTFSQVVGIRWKKAHGKKLEKWEKDFIKQNPDLVRTGAEQEQEEELDDVITAIRKGVYNHGVQNPDD